MFNSSFGQNLENLKVDKDFNKYLKTNNELLSKIKNVNKIVEILNDKKIDDKEKMGFYQNFGFKNFQELEESFKEQNNLLLQLNSKYHFEKNKDELSLIIQDPIFDEILINDNQVISNNCIDRCGRTKRNCVGAVTSAAVVAHAGCLSVDWTGYGAIICHGAAFAAQIFGHDECNNQHEGCVENCD